MALFMTILILMCCVLIAGCSNKDNPIPIDYRLSTDELLQYKNKWVTFNGYLSLWSTQDLKTGYILDIPAQKGPPIDEELFILGGIAVNTTEKLSYTDKPVKVTGKLVFGTYQDENGIKYGCKITNATVDVLSENLWPNNIQKAKNILNNNHLDIMVNALYVLEYYIFSEQNEVSEKELTTKVDFYDYEKVKSDLGNTSNETELLLLNLLEDVNILFNNVNNIIDNKEFDTLINLKQQYNDACDKLDKIIYLLNINPT